MTHMIVVMKHDIRLKQKKALMETAKPVGIDGDRGLEEAPVSSTMSWVMAPSKSSASGVSSKDWLSTRKAVATAANIDVWFWFETKAASRRIDRG